MTSLPIDRPHLVAFWAAYWALSGTFFYAMDRRGTALCDGVRYGFRMDTPTGRAAFIAAYSTGSAVLFRHVIKERALPSPRFG